MITFTSGKNELIPKNLTIIQRYGNSKSCTYMITWSVGVLKEI